MITFNKAKFDREFKKAGAEISKQIDLNMRKMAIDTEAELKKNPPEGTPIDTGVARSNWKFQKAGTDYIVSNNLEYVEYLNQGTSEQSPEKFVELAVERVTKEYEGTLNEL